MRSTQELYDCDPSDFADMPYREALRYKLRKGRELFERLFLEDIEHERQFYVHKAIRHTEGLLRELEEKEP